MAGFSGFGTVLEVDTNSDGNVDTAIAELTNISGPSVTAETIDVSSHNSLADDDGYRTFVAGLLDGGEVSVEGNLTTAVSANVLLTILNARIPVAVRITFPALATVSTWNFDAVVTAFETGAPYDDKLSFTASFKVSGEPEIA